MTYSKFISRRSFLRAAGLSAAASCLAQPLIGPSFGADDGSHWKTSIRDGHLKLTGEADCWAALRRLDVTGMEVLVDEKLVCPGLFEPGKTHSIGTSDACQALQDELARRGLSITALAMSNRVEERLAFEVDWVMKVARAAEQLKISAVRIDVVPHRLAPDKFLPVAVEACRQLCGAIKDKPVRLGIENHGNFTNNPEFLESLLHDVGSDQLGLTLDAMNFYWFGHPLPDVYSFSERFASRTFHTHCKNLRYPADKRNVRRPVGWEYDAHAAPVDDGDIEFSRVAGILRKAGYKNDLCLENECLGRFPKDQHVAILKRELATLRALT